MNKYVFSVIIIFLILLITGCAEAVVPQTSPPTSSPVPTTASPPPSVTVTIPPPPPSTTTTTSHGYFPEQSEFVFRVIDSKGSSYFGNQVNTGYTEIQAKHTSMDVRSDPLDRKQPKQLYAYQFEMKDTSTQINLLIPTEAADEIRFTTGSIYRIIYQNLPGWPNTYGLIITRESELIFAGVSDWQGGGRIKIDDSFMPILAPIAKIEQTKVLNDYYIEGGSGSSFYERMTNTEITFSLDGQSATLHQGESSVIGNYEIRLLVARETKYKAGVYDAGVNGLSYTITKTLESTPPATTAAAIEIVSFADQALENVVRKAINLPTSDITRFDLAGLWYLDASNKGITSLGGLENCAGLRQLTINGNQITDIFPLSNLYNLEKLEMNHNKVSNISALSRLVALKYLDLGVNQISDVSALSNLVNLRNLELQDNQVSNLSPISQLINLEELVLHGNQVVDISPLNHLAKLRVLAASSNKITKIPDLSGLSQLSNFQLSRNNINDISSLASLTSLAVLSLDNNKISDINSLRSLTKLIGPHLDNNQIADISVLANLPTLHDPSLDNNLITDIRPLVDNAGIGKGDYVYLRNNPLNEVSRNVYVPQLEARGVTVYLK